jgi:hypothetical protein
MIHCRLPDFYTTRQSGQVTVFDRSVSVLVPGGRRLAIQVAIEQEMGDSLAFGVLQTLRDLL